MAAIRKIQRIHKTKAINLPMDICRVLDLRMGDHLIILLDHDGWLKMRKIDMDKRPDLSIYVDADLPVIEHAA